MSKIVNLTDSARDYLKTVGDPNVFLSINSGGCAGIQNISETTDKEPHIGNLHIDPIAEMYVIGCTIDYVTELGGSFLIVSNPNATASCGCGESFAV